ncbi:MAG TPA: type II toxin-antitoxin system prevent-host-death family antitoxin [Gemmatimonadales bacterium]|nr:type II toxin-antitoxin system prevent-host-death family antitoxin [Gemmatimonadales bacterium]
MKTVGVKQLKARLSEYLRMVRAGDSVLVTDRDEVVAELRPASRRPAPREGVDDVLQGLAERGEITRAVQEKMTWTWRVRGLGLPAGTADALLDDLRAERARSDS